MDVYWANARALSLPSSQRVEVLVHDGTTDLCLWPGPGPDRDLLEAYGPELRGALSRAHKSLGRDLHLGEVLRLPPGKLHCNYLLWVATRGPEVDANQAPAPNLEVLSESVGKCLRFAAEQSSHSVGFAAMGEGPDAAEPHERLATIVRAADRYSEQCFEAGRSPGLELVRVCDPRSSVTAAARRMVGRLAKAAPVEAASAASTATAPKRRRTVAAKGERKPRAKKTPVLDANDVAVQRAGAAPYDRANAYSEGDWFVHPRFGVGQVKSAPASSNAVEVLFEDGSTRKMLHRRA